MDLKQLIQKVQDDGYSLKDGEANLILDAYKPLFLKYLTILKGNFQSPSGKIYISGGDVQRFVGEFHRAKSPLHTLRWVADRCERFDSEELLQEIRRTFLECLKYRNWFFIFPMHLARSIAQLISDPLEEVFTDISEWTPGSSVTTDIHESVRLLSSAGIPLAEQIFYDRGVIITDREKTLLRILSVGYDIKEAASRMRISKSRAYGILNNLKKKAKISK
jgi:DNA-binding CsgD family transcriptional regulator